MSSSSVYRWTKLALIAWKMRWFWTFIGLALFDVIGLAMRDGKAQFWLNTARLVVLVTLLVKTIGSPYRSGSCSSASGILGITASSSTGVREGSGQVLPLVQSIVRRFLGVGHGRKPVESEVNHTC